MASLFSAAPIAQHMGQLHAYENFIVVAIAFGPFLVLGVVVFFVRRRDLSEEDAVEGNPSEGDLPTPAEAEAASAELSDSDAEVSPGRPPAT